MQLYLIAKIMAENTVKTLKYRIIDIESGNTEDMREEDLLESLKIGSWGFENVAIDKRKDSKIKVKEGMENIPTLDEKGNILSNKQYVLALTNEIEQSTTILKFNGEILTVEAAEMNYYDAKVAGLPINYNNKHWEKEEQTKEKERLVKSKINTLYELFILKTRALCLDCSFNYIVEGETGVRLTEYTGKSTHVIIPGFITIIGSTVFCGKNITNVSLTDGLQEIRYNAFAMNNIGNVDIPKTVRHIGRAAFAGNDRLFKSKGAETILNTDKFKIYSERIEIKNQVL